MRDDVRRRVHWRALWSLAKSFLLAVTQNCLAEGRVDPQHVSIIAEKGDIT